MPEIYYKRKTPSGVVAPPWMHPVWVEWKYLSPSSAPKLLRCAPNVLRNYWISGGTNTLTDTVSCKSGYNYLRSLVDRYHPDSYTLMLQIRWLLRSGDLEAICGAPKVLRNDFSISEHFRSTRTVSEHLRDISLAAEMDDDTWESWERYLADRM